MESHRDVLDIEDLITDFPDEEIFECYDCNWSGEKPESFEPDQLFEKIEGEDLLCCCPICGSLLT